MRYSITFGSGLRRNELRASLQFQINSIVVFPHSQQILWEVAKVSVVGVTWESLLGHSLLLAKLE